MVRSHSVKLWGKHFGNVDTSLLCYDSTAVRQLRPNFDKRVAQLVALFTSDAHEHGGTSTSYSM